MTLRDDLAIGSIVTKSGLALARVLGHSLRQHHPELPFFVLLADEIDGWFDPEQEPFQLLRLHDLAIPDLRGLCFRYEPLTLSYALTPHLLAHLLDRGFPRAIFLKQESMLLGPQSAVFEQLGRHAILLTPHLLAPLSGDEAVGRELRVLQAGAFNGGFVGVTDSSSARELLSWWRDRLAFHCEHAVGRGQHWEQRFLDLVPALFEGVGVVRDPSCNVGHWNVTEREVDVREGELLVSGQPAGLFRFSGFDPDRPEAVTRHAERPRMTEIGAAALAFERYARALDAAGHAQTRHWPFAFASFDDGVAIPEVARALYRELGEGAARFGDPFQGGPGSFREWLGQPVAEGTGVSRLCDAVWRLRSDLQEAFPDPPGEHNEAFLAWCRNAEHGIPTEFVPGPR
jgi:hypothetical protein